MTHVDKLAPMWAQISPLYVYTHSHIFSICTRVHCSSHSQYSYCQHTAVTGHFPTSKGWRGFLTGSHSRNKNVWTKRRQIFDVWWIIFYGSFHYRSLAKCVALVEDIEWILITQFRCHLQQPLPKYTTNPYKYGDIRRTWNKKAISFFLSYFQKKERPAFNEYISMYLQRCSG